MRLSKLFSSTSKNVPADETSKNAQLLIKAGFIHKEMAGVYSFLPLGLRVIENIKKIVREEMNELGGQELLMTSLQRKELWQKTDRWDDKKVDIWFKSKLQNDTEVGLAWSHEEPITDMIREFASSYRDLPTYVYQFQTKLRNEVRAKSGIMRCREFQMKDLYSYTKDEKEHQKFYDAVTKSYLKIFDRVGVGDKTFFTFASGGAFTQFSHEFQTLTDAGEDTIYLDRSKKLAVNAEVMSDDVLKQLGLKKDNLEKVKAAEVGNIFNFGTKKSEQLDLYFTDEQGRQKLVVLGSYGIGISRLMGTIAEVLSDENGLVWPENVAPAKAIIVSLGNNAQTQKAANNLYDNLQTAGVEVLYDDRELSAGEKFADADLIGVPYRVVVSDKTVAAGKFELKKRTSKKEIELLDEQGIIDILV